MHLFCKPSSENGYRLLHQLRCHLWRRWVVKHQYSLFHIVVES